MSAATPTLFSARLRRPNIEAPLAVWEYVMSLERMLDELLADTLVLMDQTTSEEVEMEARRRVIERFGKPA